MYYWVGVDDTRNNGWPKVIYHPEKPGGYLRVYGPYNTKTDADTKAEDLPAVTTGYRAVCGYSQRDPAGTTVYSEHPLNINQYGAFYGPYDTEEQAEIKAATLTCPFVTSPAIDVCDPSVEYSVPVTLKCSLVCSALQWPMSGGTVNLTFYRRTCEPDEPERSEHLPGTYSVSLGCSPSEVDTPTSTWIGRSGATNVILLTDPTRGYTLRFSATMTVVTASQVTVSIKVERLIAGVDLDPNSPPANQWVTCSTYSATCDRVVGVGVDPDDRTLTRTYTSDLVDVTFGSQCSTDVQYSQVSVILNPMRFGCDGTANGGVQSNCSLNTNRVSYSCFVAHVRCDGLLPQTVQLGVNGTGATSNGCFTGSYSTGGSYTISPAYGEENGLVLLNAGCPAEVTELTQKIQYGTASDFQVMLKSVDKGPIWCGVRRGAGYTWRWRILDSTSIVSSVPYTHSVSIPNVDHETGTKTVHVDLYALQFPPVSIDTCHGVDTSTEGVSTYFTEPVVMAQPRVSKSSFPLRCIHLGPILKRSCCGAPSLHECLKGLGNCRPNGAAWTDDEISCCTCKHRVVQSDQE